MQAAVRTMKPNAGVVCALAMLIASAATAQAQPSPAPTTMPAGERPWFQQAQVPIKPELPTLWIIGDSTVRNGRDTGNNGQWGWGNPIRRYFDETKINIQNRAVGGTSSRTFWRDQWPWIMQEIKPGDYVIMQFGHNDNGPVNDDFRARGTFRDNSERSEEIDNILTGKHEVVHSYGWYLRKYASDAKQRGAVMSIICSPIPRRSATRPDGYGPIAKQAAGQIGAPYIDLNERILTKYAELGQQKVTDELFPEGESTHPDWAGAVLNAEIVIQAVRDLDNPLAKFLLAEPPKDLKNPTGRPR